MLLVLVLADVAGVSAAGDGATSVVVLAAALLQQAGQLLNRGIHVAAEGERLLVADCCSRCGVWWKGLVWLLLWPLVTCKASHRSVMSTSVTCVRVVGCR